MSHQRMSDRTLLKAGKKECAMQSTSRMFKALPVVILLLVFACIGQAAAQSWTQLSPTGGPPVTRMLHTAVYDQTNNRMIVFGGRNGPTFSGYCSPSNTECLNDVWVLQNADGLGGTPTWTQLFPAGTPPSRRGYHAAVYDSANNRMIIYGGDPNIGFCNGAVNDVWVLSNANGLGGTPIWTQLSPTGGPPPLRQGPKAVYDPSTNRMVIFGGNANSCVSGGSDVWVLANANGLGGTPTWTQFSPAGTSPGGGVGSHTTVYDPTTNRMILFGGYISGLSNGIWVLSNANGLGGTPIWTQLSPTGGPPSPRYAHTAVYKSETNQLVAFAGATSTGAVNDVWVLSNANGLGGTPAWFQLSPTGGPPSPRHSHTAVLHTAADRMVIYAGANNSGYPLGDVWVLPDTTTPVCVAPPSGMVSWWPGDGNANDIISTNHGALVNGATFAPGMVGQGFSFDGVDDEVLIGNPTNLRLQDFTIDAWIRLNTLTITGFAERIAGYSIGGYGFFLAGPSVVNANGASAVRQLSLDKAGFDMVAAPLAINDTGWHHVAVTKSGGTVTFYLDGVAGAAQRGGLPITSYNPGFVFNTYFALGNLDGQNQPFPGLLDEVEVFNRALTASEIQAIYNAGSVGKCKTALPDTTPEPFTFIDLTDVPVSSTQTSNAITVSGITGPAAITIVGGEYEVNSSGAWSSSAGTVVNGDIVRVRHTSAATYSTAAHTTLTIGGVSDTFTSTTLAGDTTPDPFAFTDQTGVSLDTVIPSNAIPVAGINSPATISISACTSSSCEYAINGGAWTGAPGTVTNSQTVQVQQRSAATPSTTTHLTLAIGGVADTFSVTTLADTTPPVLTLPADITTPATSPAGAVVTYVATATDAIDGALTPTCAPPAGSTFPIGTITVTCSATDAAGNTASGSFQITVTVALTIAPTPLHGSITSSVGSINCGTSGSACTAAFGGGATVTLSRAADSGYVFGGWTGACSAQGLAATCTLTMDADKTVGATFNLHPMNLIVNSAADLVDALPGDGICATATGVCTLRAAVMEANAMAGADAILFDSSVNGTPITLTIAGAGENAAETGDLDVTGSVTITGNGMDNTIIQACDATANPSCSGIDRIFDVQDGAALNLSGVMLRNGRGSSEPFGRSGGAIRVGLHLPWEGGNGTSSSLILSNSALLNNVATVHGGAISSIGSVTISNSVITGNRAAGGSGGGVLNNLGGTLTVSNSTFSANTADGGGGAVFANPGSLPAPVTITNSTISENTSGGAGGGLFQNGGSSAFTVTNTTISGNRAAGHGGGIISAGSGTTLASVTVTGNTADSDGNNDGDGGGLQGTATVKNSIIAGNSDLSAGASAVVRPDCAGTISSQGYNLIGNGTGCSGAVNGANGDQVGTDEAPIDPTLGPLQDNGGSTETHALLGGSPAIDAANPAGCTDSAGALLTTDQRGMGYPRAIDADSDGTVRCDIGAVEILDGTPPTTTAAPSPPPNIHGWNNTNVTVSLNATDNTSGTGVKEIEFALAGAQGGGGVVGGSVASVTVTAEGITTLTYFARDNAGNQETAKTLTVQIDKTSPTVTATQTPAPNANGWNNTAVTVAGSGTDSLSGIASCTSIALMTDGAGQSTTVSCTDKAGNIASATRAVNIDKTPPVVTFGALSPAPNIAGWNNTDVSIPFTAGDSLSGIASASPASPLILTLEGVAVTGVVTVTDNAGNSAVFPSPAVNIDKTSPIIMAMHTPAPNVAGWNTTDVTKSFACTDEPVASASGIAICPPPQIITAEGITMVNVQAMDVAGNITTHTQEVKIDKTVPELAARCAPPGAPLVVVGRDGLSGAASVVPGASVPLRQGKFKERRTFIVLDLAGNQLQADFGVKTEGHEAQIALLGLAYNGQAVPDLPENELKCEWALEKKTGAVKELEQKLTIEDQSESRSEHDKTKAQAKFRAKKNETEIRIKRPEPEQQVTRTGLVFLRLTTDQGDIGFDF
ncbi:HYR domain-containing protein [Patescibacteria group bacterium]|nr:MAG: HYR domain-containing protein [Patescibacteria group bacterium]